MANGKKEMWEVITKHAQCACSSTKCHFLEFLWQKWNWTRTFDTDCIYNNSKLNFGYLIENLITTNLNVSFGHTHQVIIASDNRVGRYIMTRLSPDECGSLSYVTKLM
jgi:hypothetical protein